MEWCRQELELVPCCPTYSLLLIGISYPNSLSLFLNVVDLLYFSERALRRNQVAAVTLVS